ncbi:MAG: AraC family transcriptional regulator [Oscillospiraceae bacterium]|nr:AraC family transcriptional regulator [Oscillospiraceae bacterium]
MPRKEFVRTTIGDIRLELFVPAHVLLTSGHTWAFGRHSNADYELHIVRRGTCRVDVEGTVYTLHAGQGVLISPDRFHTPVDYSPDFLRMVMNLFPVSGRLLPNPEEPCVVVDFPPSISALLDELMDEFAHPGPFHQKMLDLLLSHLTLLLLRLLGIKDTDATAVTNSDLRVDVIDSFFSNSLGQNVTKAELCKRLHLSPRQLHRFLEKRYGMSFREKLASTRMTHAGWLLRNTDLSIQQVALQVGYTSVPSFSRSFSHFHNCSPRQFRHQQDTLNNRTAGGM